MTTLVLLPGQGGQVAGMGQERLEHDPVFAEQFYAVLELSQFGSITLDSYFSTEDADLADPQISQTMLFAVNFALCRSLTANGVALDLLLGHSGGELAAAAASGVFTPEEAVEILDTRLARTGEAAEGRMAAVACSAVDAAGVCAEYGLNVAADNGAAQAMIAGGPGALAAATEVFVNQGVSVMPVHSTRAFHSHMLSAAATASEESLEWIREAARPPRAGKVVSCYTGKALTFELAASPHYWAHQISTPVLFRQALATAQENKPKRVIETGPRPLLSPLLRRTGRRYRDGTVQMEIAL